MSVQAALKALLETCGATVEHHSDDTLRITRMVRASQDEAACAAGE